MATSVAIASLEAPRNFKSSSWSIVSMVHTRVWVSLLNVTPLVPEETSSGVFSIGQHVSYAI